MITNTFFCRIILIDDSIVRSNTMLSLVRLLKEHGAKEVRDLDPSLYYPLYPVPPSTPPSILLYYPSTPLYYPYTPTSNLTFNLTFNPTSNLTFNITFNPSLFTPTSYTVKIVITAAPPKHLN